MESSREGRLGLKKLRRTEWKGRTFSQVSSTIQKNMPVLTSNDRRLLFSPLPLKIYRQELTKSSGPGRSVRRTMETPGGTVVNSSASDVCKDGVTNMLYDESKSARCNVGCKLDVPNAQQNSKYMQSLSQQDNARRRVRSSGMSRPRYDSSHNNRREGYSSAAEYMHSRNKTFKQNQFSNLRVGDANAIPGGVTSQENVYASNTLQYCGNDPKTSYVPVYYKPNNSKYAQQGAVGASARLLRLKYDTITQGGNVMREAYGAETANALAYGVPNNGYTIKDKVGYPNKCTPTFPKKCGWEKRFCDFYEHSV